MLSKNEKIIAIIVLAVAIVYNGMCQRYEPVKAGSDGACTRFNRFRGEYQQKTDGTKWEDIAFMGKDEKVR